MKLKIIIGYFLFIAVAGARGLYQRPQDFVAEVFHQQVPSPQFLWMTADNKNAIKKILGHPYRKLRIKYWRDKNQSVWVLDEIGKEEPITVGIVVNNHSDKGEEITLLRVLEYRESRGDEVRHDFFTIQFQGAAIDQKGDLDQHIDGITGATLSVNALKRLSKLALYLTRSLNQSENG